MRLGVKLLSIRSSDIAFAMGTKGQLPEATDGYEGVIEEF